MRLKIDKNADLQGLAYNMVLEAVRDLKDKRKPEKQLDAMLWLTSPDFPIWAEVWSMPFADSWQMLVSGAARKFREPRENHARARLAENV